MYDLRLAVPPDWGPTVAGQFVSISLERAWREDEPGGGGALLRRPFSIAGYSKGEDHSELRLLYAPVGKVTGRLCEAQPGTRLELMGPRGTAFPLPADHHPVLVGGGRGLAPFLYVADELLAEERAFTLLYGLRTAAQRVGLGRLESSSLVATEDGTGGTKGTVIDLLDQLPPLPQPPAVLACGPHGMLAAVADWARSREIPCWVSLEEVFGCGIGICAGCAIPAIKSHGGEYGRFLWACREGPVVAAEDVDWERWRELWG